MDKAKITEIEQFSNIGSGVELLGYNTESNKVGTVPISAITSKSLIAGARWRLDSSSPIGEPYGDFDMIKSLVSVLGLGGYLVTNDHQRKKLDPTNHFKLANGSTAALDGTMGHYQWGWNVPFYYATWKDETYLYEAISTSPITGHWNYRIPVASLSASGAAALDRTNNILVSYCNRSAQYRGGTNDATLDGKWNTHLGKPVVNVNCELLHQYAVKNGVRWGASMFMVHFVVAMLMRIVFHNRDGQAAFNAALKSDGLHQGGLGIGIDNVSGKFGGQYATCDIDALANKGDALGVFNLSLTDDSAAAQNINNISCFYGLKNPFHYIWNMMHGVLLSCNADKSIDVYIKKIWNSEVVPTSSLTGLEKIGTIPTSASEGWAYPLDMNLTNLCFFPLLFGGSTSQRYCDGFYHPSATSGLRGLAVSSSAGDGAEAGPCALAGYYAPSLANVYFGASLCEAAEDWDTTPFWVP